MKCSLDWLNAYLDRPASAEQAAAALASVGFPDDGVETITHADGSTDTQIDIEVTSNRGDCLCHVGLARELAAATGRQLKLPPDDLPTPDADEPVDKLTCVANDAPDLCPVYTARVVIGVKIGPSPEWLARRLEAVGLRPVNNVVDITNFVLLETGQPLHAFDLGKLDGRRIVVRRATPGEKFTAIDGSKHELREDMLVIADASKPQAVAGVMGGLDSEVGDQTRDLLIESAAFAPLSIRRTSRALKLASDSSYRFERGVDPRAVERASRRAAAMIVELAGGKLAQGVIRVGVDEPHPQELSLRVARCNKLLGVALTAEQQATYLERLGLRPRIEGETIRVTVPSYRLDLQREVDLIEEVARHHGLDQIPVHEKITLVTHRKQDRVIATERLYASLIAHGYHETITPTFLPPDDANAFAPPGAQALAVDPDRRSADPALRPSLLPSLLHCRKLNQDRGNDGVKLFEVAQVFGRVNGQMKEQTCLAMLADADDAGAALREMRGALEEALVSLGGSSARPRLSVEPLDGDARYAVAAALRLDGEEVGRFGVLAGTLQKRFGLQSAAALLETRLEPWLLLYPPAAATAALAKFPAIKRDLSVIVAEPVRWAQLEATIHAVKPDLLESVRFITTYRGKPIEKGGKSVSLRMIFRDPQRTLRHEQVDPQVAAVVAALSEKCGAVLRA